MPALAPDLPDKRIGSWHVVAMLVVAPTIVMVISIVVAIAMIGDSLIRPGMWVDVVHQMSVGSQQAGVETFMGAWNRPNAIAAAVVYIAGMLVFSWPAKRRTPPAPRR